jgi:uncharacterized protein (DUF2336 family)
MTLPQIADDEPAPGPAPKSRARAALLKRLADVVCLPSTRVNAFERAMTADLLVEMLREAEPEERARVSRRLAHLTEIPHSLLRLLLRDDIEVARPLLDDCASLSETDLIRCARESTTDHRRLIAVRRGVGELLSETLIEIGEAPVVEPLLRNAEARLSQPAIETVVALSRDHGRYVGLLLRRPELRPSHAYVMFWWAGADERRTVLQRFAVSREVLQDASGDVFPMMAAENWQDPLARKALQFIERRQRNRAAIAKSPYESLDQAIEQNASGLTRLAVEEISYLSGLKPSTGAKIFTDLGGEPLAVLCKATGLPKAALRQLWRGLRRPETDAEGRVTEALERVLIAYDMIAVDRAQTVLRYWNWALSSALTPDLVKAIRDQDEDGLDEHSTPQKAAMLVFSAELAR